MREHVVRAVVSSGGDFKIQTARAGGRNACLGGFSPAQAACRDSARDSSLETGGQVTKNLGLTVVGGSEGAARGAAFTEGRGAGGTRVRRICAGDGAVRSTLREGREAGEGENPARVRVGALAGRTSDPGQGYVWRA